MFLLYVLVSRIDFQKYLEKSYLPFKLFNYSVVDTYNYSSCLL